MRVAAQMYSYIAVCVQNHVNQVSKCVHLQERSAVDISASVPFNNVSPAEKIIEAVHF